MSPSMKLRSGGVWVDETTAGRYAKISGAFVELVPAPSVTTVLSMTGAINTFAQTPDSVAVSVPSAIDIRAKLGMPDWSPSETKGIVNKFGGTTNERSFRLEVRTTGTLTFRVGIGAGTDVTSTASTGFANGAVKWIRVTFVDSTNVVQFFTSDDGSSWTQLGSDLAITAVLRDSSTPVTIGTTGPTAPFEVFQGDIYYIEIRDGVDGTVVLSFDPNTVTKLGTRNPTTLAAGGTAGGTWTMNGTGWDWTEIPP